jgi:acyl-CoA thioesterase
MAKTAFSIVVTNGGEKLYGVKSGTVFSGPTVGDALEKAFPEAPENTFISSMQKYDVHPGHPCDDGSFYASQRRGRDVMVAVLKT